MSQPLRQSTAVNLRIGPFVSRTDGYTPMTALTLTVNLSKGGSFAERNSATAITHEADGWYVVPLDTTDTNTLGRLTVYVAHAQALPVWEQYTVIDEVVYDEIVGGVANDLWTTDLVLGGYTGDQAGKKLLDILGKVLLITEDSVNFAGIVDYEHFIFTVVRGTDYSPLASTISPEWSNEDWSVFDLQNATVTFRAKQEGATTTFSTAVTVVDATTIRLDLTVAQTALFNAEPYKPYIFQVFATLDGGYVVPLIARGKMLVIDQL